MSKPGRSEMDFRGSGGDTLQLATELINRASVTPEDGGCQETIKSRLAACGFNCETHPFEDVTNLWARIGTKSPLVCFAGHTDVVPPGDLADWDSDPFTADVRDGRLYGRGAADMKGALAAMITAAERFVAATPAFAGSIAFLITSDEEGIAKNGTRAVIDMLQKRNENIDYCVVGEPSSTHLPGDTVRIGRRGSLTGTLSVNGIQGHVAYAHLANNPIRAFAAAMAALNVRVWDRGNEYFPPTSFEFVHLQSSSGADNVTPGSLDAKFNFRFSTEWTHDALRKNVETLLSQHDLDYTLDWHLSGEPFFTKPGPLTTAAIQAIRIVSQIEPELSTGGGTSDGRFISPTGADVIEVGLVNATIHQVNENVEVHHLDLVSEVYARMLALLLTDKSIDSSAGTAT